MLIKCHNIMVCHSKLIKHCFGKRQPLVQIFNGMPVWLCDFPIINMSCPLKVHFRKSVMVYFDLGFCWVIHFVHMYNIGNYWISSLFLLKPLVRVIILSFAQGFLTQKMFFDLPFWVLTKMSKTFWWSFLNAKTIGSPSFSIWELFLSDLDKWH